MLFNISLIIFTILFAILSWRKINWSIFLIILGLPSYLLRFTVFGLPMTVLEVMILVLFLVWLLKLKFCKVTRLGADANILILRMKQMVGKFFSRTLVILVSGFLIFSFISIFWAPDLKAAAGIWKAYFLEPVLFFIVFINVINNKKDLKKVFLSLGGLVIYLGLIAIYQKITGSFIPEVSGWHLEETRRVTTFFSSPNSLSLLVGPVLVLLIGSMIEKFKSYKVTRLGADANILILRMKQMASKFFSRTLVILVSGFLILFLGLVSIIFSVSQAAWLAVGCSLVFLFFFTVSKKWTSLLVVLGIVIILFLPGLQQKIKPVLRFQDQAGQSRLILWQAAEDLLEVRPIRGMGLAGFDDYFNPRRDPLKIESHIYPHNFILNFWVEVGLFGLLSVLLLLVFYFKTAIKNILKNKNRILNFTLIAVMLEILIHGLVDVPYFKNDLAVLFWLFMGVLVVLHELHDF